jgi:acetoin utilization deacetylase AcuC-like enzyme
VEKGLCFIYAAAGTARRGDRERMKTIAIVDYDFV